MSSERANEHSSGDTEQSECGQCGETPAPHLVDVANEDSGEVGRFRLCDDCHDKLLAYNRGGEVDWNV